MPEPEMLISRRLLSWTAAVAAIGALLAVGYLATPRVGGRPVLLSPANWRLTRYLAAAEQWLAVLVEEQACLAGMVPPAGPQPEDQLPVFAEPLPATTVYKRSRALERSMARLNSVRRAMEETEPPAALAPLHALATATADEVLTLQETVAIALGSPSAGAREKAQGQAQAAAEHLTALERALEAQLALLGEETTPEVP